MIDVNEYLKNFYKGTKNPSLKAMKYFMDKYDNFEKNMKFIHIAGTNGKGSCTEIISNILKEEGYKVGKFLSPHLIKYNERISINGKEISDEDMNNIIEELEPLIEEYNKKDDINITLFELETTMALLYFYRNNVDFVVLETGLGGLYDCTNIISKPLVSIITSIGYDHMHLLGNTLEKIAYQKAGIIKESSNTVIFESIKEVDNVFIKECNKKNNNLHIVKKSDISNYSYDNNFQYFNYKNIENLQINLKGKIQIQNAGLCLETIKILNELGYKVSKKSIKNGLKSIVHKGRMETLNNNPLVIFDGAHNEPAIKIFKEMVNMYYRDCKRTYIISILKRKDYKKMIEELSKDKDAIFIVTSGDDSDKFLTEDELYSYAENFIQKQNLYKMKLVDAINNVINEKNNSVNFVVGSFYVYDTVKRTINGCSTFLKSPQK